MFLVCGPRKLKARVKCIDLKCLLLRSVINSSEVLKFRTLFLTSNGTVSVEVRSSLAT